MLDSEVFSSLSARVWGLLYMFYSLQVRVSFRCAMHAGESVWLQASSVGFSKSLRVADPCSVPHCESPLSCQYRGERVENTFSFVATEVFNPGAETLVPLNALALSS